MTTLFEEQPMATKNDALATVPATPITPMGPMEMIQASLQSAMNKGEGLEVYDRLLERMERQRDYDDREAFNAALQRIQSKLKSIPKRGWNPDTKSKFAKEEDIDKVLDSLLFEERMSLNFEPESHPQPEMMRVVGILSLGAYSKRYPLDMPADGKGAKGGGVMSRTHAMGSAITYGKRYLKTMMFNLHFKDTDDDGNAAAGLTVNVYAPLMDAIENGHTIGDVTAAYIRALKAAKTDTEKAAFEAAANKRKAELK
jgi:hypothetical protein